MNLAKFNQSFREVEDTLKKINIFRQKGIKNINNDGVSIEFKNTSQKGNYISAYKIALEKFDYDFLLEDQSFFQFEFKESHDSKKLPLIRYAYFQNPQETTSYEDYLLEQGLSNEELDEIGDSWQNDYEQYLTEMELNLSATTIRFDVENDVKNYLPLIHSNAHIHIGHRSDIRIPFDKIITPLQFVFFVIKNTNYQLWKDSINKLTWFKSMVIKEKRNSTLLNSSFWGSGEKDDIHLI